MEPLNGFHANVAPSEAAGLPAACLAKRLACAGVGRAAKRCAGMGAGCGGKYHVDGIYIILSVRQAGQSVELPRLAQAAKHHVDAVYLIRGAGSTRARRTLRLPGRGLRRQVPCRRRLHNPQRSQGGRQLLASLTFSCAGVSCCKAWSCQGAKTGCPNAHGPRAR